MKNIQGDLEKLVQAFAMLTLALSSKAPKEVQARGITDVQKIHKRIVGRYGKTVDVSSRTFWKDIEVRAGRFLDYLGKRYVTNRRKK